jgi:hypothetical protein
MTSARSINPLVSTCNWSDARALLKKAQEDAAKAAEKEDWDAADAALLSVYKER